MNYEISISDDGTYVRIKVFESVTAELESNFAEKAIKDARQHNIKNFLVDVRGTKNVASSTEHYMFGYKELNQFGLDRSSRIAIIADEDDTSHHFIETVLVNDRYHCKIFTDEEAALKWFVE